MRVLFLDEKILKERTVISDNIDSKVLLQCIYMVQEEKILPVLGTKLYEKLTAGVTGNSLSTDERTLLNTYVTNAMLWYVLAELPMALGPKFYNRGVLKKTGDNDENLSMSELFDVMKYYQNKGEGQEQRMIDYLKKNCALFPEYLQHEQYDIEPKKSGFSCPIVLDDE